MAKKSLLFAVVLSLSIFGILFVGTDTTQAITPARCKVQTLASSSSTYADCSSLGINVPGTTFEQDKCYLVTLGQGGNSAVEQSCGAAQCQQNTPLGSTPPGDCPDYSGMAGAPAIVAGHCYITTIGTSFVAEEKNCLGPPFAENWTTAACRDGTFQGGSNTTPEELCKDHGGAGAAIYVTCADGESFIVDKVLEHQEGYEERLCKDHGGTKASAAAAFVGPAGASIDVLPKSSANKDAIQKVLSFVFALAGAIALLMIAFGGFKYTTSHGEPQAIAKAKNTIMYAVIGLIVVVLANFAVAYLITSIS